MADDQAEKNGKPRGKSFSKTNQPSREPRPGGDEGERDFAQLARRIITDPRAQRALLRRARPGDLRPT